MSNVTFAPLSLAAAVELLDRLPESKAFELLVGSARETSEELDLAISRPTIQLLNQLTLEMCRVLMAVGIFKEADPAAAHLEHFPMLVAALSASDSDNLKDLPGLCEDACYEYERAYNLLQPLKQSLKPAA